MRYLKLKIPVKTYIRKYLEYHYPGPQKITYTNELGKLVFMCLEKQSSHVFDKPSVNLLEKRFRGLTDHYIVLLPAGPNTFYRTGFEIPPANLALINLYFEESLVKELFLRARTFEKVGISNNQVIEEFCEEYDIIIDVDITHAAFKKALYRYRKSRKEREPVESLVIDSKQKETVSINRLEIVIQPEVMQPIKEKPQHCFPCNDLPIFNVNVLSESMFQMNALCVQ